VAARKKEICLAYLAQLWKAKLIKWRLVSIYDIVWLVGDRAREPKKTEKQVSPTDQVNNQKVSGGVRT